MGHSKGRDKAKKRARHIGNCWRFSGPFIVGGSVVLLSLLSGISQGGEASEKVEGTTWICKHPEGGPTIVEFKKEGKLVVSNPRSDIWGGATNTATYTQTGNSIAMRIGIPPAKCTVHGNKMQCTGPDGIVSVGLGPKFELEKK